MHALKIELYDTSHPRSPSERWRWRTRCPENGNILARSSEGYGNKLDCVEMIHRHFGDDATIVQVRP